MTAVTSLAVQGYFCYRIRVLTNRRSWICWIIAVMAVTQTAAEIWLSITSLVAEKYVVSKTALYLWSIPTAIADILIAVAMTLLLRRASGEFPNFILVRVRGSHDPCTLCRLHQRAILRILRCVGPLLCRFPANTKRIVILRKLYSNTLLVSFNNRIYFREHKLPGHGDSAFLTVTDGVRATALSSPRFAVPEPQLRTPTGDNSQLCAISRTVELDRGN
ncbi:hypothetical protein EDB86DRAFT_829281 [Lactarius hatsudake]|nr:hypothetical protein EDB86DRAFT_829281 [Lactarius hatsudake]